MLRASAWAILNTLSARTAQTGHPGGTQPTSLTTQPPGFTPPTSGPGELQLSWDVSPRAPLREQGQLLGASEVSG